MKKPSNHLLISSLIIIHISVSMVSSFADPIADARKSALDFGETFKNTASSTLNAENKKNIPGYVSDNPEQTKYYSSDGSINSEAIKQDSDQKIKDSSVGDLMTNGLVNRPKIEISLNDDFLNSSKAIEGNPDQVVAMLTGNYPDCKPLTFTSTSNEIRTCNQYQEPNCIAGNKLVQVTSGVETSFNHPYLQVDISRRGGGGCTKYYANSTINIVDVTQITAFQLLSVRWDDVIEIKLNGRVIFANGDMNSPSCERAIDFNVSPNIDLKPYLINGDNKLELALGVSGMGNATARYYLNYDQSRTCPIIDNCLNIPSNCQLQNSQCLNFGNDNICNYTQKIYNCSNTVTTNSSTNLSCGPNVYCANDQCTKIGEDTNPNDFAKSISYLQVLNQTAKDKTSDLKIFTGSKNSCDKELAGYNNCCSDNGWGQDITGTSCKESEVQLLKSQEKKLCHFVGSYCSKKIPLAGTCQTTTKSYCCFTSKISRVIVEQGKFQLSSSWGDAESPNCGGFTPEELQKLQFNKMDLSEISQDITNQIISSGQTQFQVQTSKQAEDNLKKKMEGYAR